MGAMSKLSALLVQAQLGWNHPQQNRDHLRALVAEVDAAADLIVLPETFTTGFLGDADLPEEGMDGPTVAWMKALADERRCAVTGSAVIVENGHRYNRMLFVSAGGDVRHYDKRHLFSYGGENERYTAGAERVIVEHLGWRINLQVCYDLRFPAWCRNRGDYDLMLFVANWPSRRVAHWSALLTARAIENQAWVIGVNCAGEGGNGIRYPGCSVVHDPMGVCVADLGAEEKAQIVELDLEMVGSTRARLPFQADADDFTLL